MQLTFVAAVQLLATINTADKRVVTYFNGAPAAWACLMHLCACMLVHSKSADFWIKGMQCSPNRC